MEKPAPIATVTVVLPPAAESLPASEEAAFVPPDAGAAASDAPPPHAVQLKTTAMPLYKDDSVFHKADRNWRSQPFCRDT